MPLASRKPARIPSRPQDRPSQPSAAQRPKWGKPSAPGFKKRLAATLSAKSEAARTFALHLVSTETSGDALGRYLGFADGTQIYRLTSGEGASARLIAALDQLAQEIGVPSIAQAGCGSRFAVVPMPDSPPPPDFFRWIASLGDALRCALTPTH